MISASYFTLPFDFNIIYYNEYQDIFQLIYVLKVKNCR
jgi:hypothetical protein